MILNYGDFGSLWGTHSFYCDHFQWPKLLFILASTFREIQALTRQFEEKYGGASEKIRQKKKTRNKDDYADLGYGYDSDDPFIG